ncbi:FAM72 protein-domain-containing protein [Paraphysoderma sedebokerense]|nr:FAM72 protein-domain-containing protein [Paraphysoderma sedebokerense]
MSPPNSHSRRLMTTSLLQTALSNSTSSTITSSSATANATNGTAQMTPVFSTFYRNNDQSSSRANATTPPPRRNSLHNHHNHHNSSNHHHQSFSRSNSQSHQSPQIHPQFRSKAVCKLTCKHCLNLVCLRGMKAILLADTRVELYSTDLPPNGSVQLVNDDYITRNCRCRIRDVACLGCGNVVGYHVTQPCDTCLDACNNGHFWMFHSDGIKADERKDGSGSTTLLWANLPIAEKDAEASPQKNILCR